MELKYKTTAESYESYITTIDVKDIADNIYKEVNKKINFLTRQEYVRRMRKRWKK